MNIFFILQILAVFQKELRVNTLILVKRRKKKSYEIACNTTIEVPWISPNNSLEKQQVSCFGVNKGLFCSHLFQLFLICT